jgi:MSHA pilin protein MshA
MKMLQKGFTLIELVVVIVILGILAAVAIPQFTDLSASAKTAVGKGACGALQSAAVLLFASKTTFSTIGAIQLATTISTGASWGGSCLTPTYTDVSGSPITTCSQIPSAFCQ